MQNDRNIRDLISIPKLKDNNKQEIEEIKNNTKFNNKFYYLYKQIRQFLKYN